MVKVEHWYWVMHIRKFEVYVTQLNTAETEKNGMTLPKFQDSHFRRQPTPRYLELPPCWRRSTSYKEDLQIRNNGVC